MAIRAPASWFSSVLFPTLGRPIRAANPLRCAGGGMGPSLRRRSSSDGEALQHDIALGPVIGALRQVVGDLVDDFLATDDLAEDGVLAVEPGGGHHGDEELAAVG